MTNEASVSELALLVSGEVRGSTDLVVRRVSVVDVGGDDAIVLAENKRYFDRASSVGAACILTKRGLGEPASGCAAIWVADPKRAFIRILEFFRRAEPLPPVGVGPGAVLERGVTLGRSVAIGANSYVGESASLGDDCVLFPNVCVGSGASIGEGSRLYPGVVIYPGCRIGRRVTIHAGTVIGADGFGYVPDECGLKKCPHLGSVEIGDDVEIGANSAVDRAKIGATVIGRGTKIDNLVHIAHNVRIGSGCAIVALSGIAGSVVIGDGVTLAAQSGVSDHVSIADGCVVAARGGVIGDLEAGKTVSGFPARDHKQQMRMQAVQARLPEMIERLRALESRLKELEKESKDTPDENTRN